MLARSLFLIFLIFLFSFVLFTNNFVSAQTPSEVPPENPPESSTEQTPQYFGLLTYSLADMLVPSKWGLSLGMIRSGNTTMELEYLRGRISSPLIIADIGSITDERISFMVRSYGKRKYFHYIYGLTFFNFRALLGDELLSDVTNTSLGTDIVKVQAFGFNLGIGHRWKFKNGITLGLDWFNWSQPVLVTENKSVFLDYTDDDKDRENVEEAIDFAAHFPRLTFFKLQAGMSF